MCNFHSIHVPCGYTSHSFLYVTRSIWALHCYAVLICSWRNLESVHACIHVNIPLHIMGKFGEYRVLNLANPSSQHNYWRLFNLVTTDPDHIHVHVHIQCIYITIAQCLAILNLVIICKLGNSPNWNPHQIFTLYMYSIVIKVYSCAQTHLNLLLHHWRKGNILDSTMLINCRH